MSDNRKLSCQGAVTSVLAVLILTFFTDGLYDRVNNNVVKSLQIHVYTCDDDDSCEYCPHYNNLHFPTVLLGIYFSSNIFVTFSHFYSSLICQNNSSITYYQQLRLS